MRIENRLQLQLWREECKEKHQKEKCRILVCGGTGCLAGGSDKIYARFKEMSEGMDHVTVKIGEEIAHPGVKMSGCHGFCEMGPLVRIEPYNYLYLKVKLEDCEEIFEKTILRGEPVERLMYHDDHKVYETQEEIPFYAEQTRLVLKNCGHIDAEHIEEAIAAGAYESLKSGVRDDAGGCYKERIRFRTPGTRGCRIPDRKKMVTGSWTERKSQICCL